MVIKVGPSPPADLAAFLQPYASLVSRGQSRHAMERYTTGLLADIPRKTAADLGRGVAGTNGQRLQEFLTNTEWDYREMDRLRMQYMVTQASLGRGLQIIDDTGFAKKGTHSVGVARQYSGTPGWRAPLGPTRRWYPGVINVNYSCRPTTITFASSPPVGSCQLRSADGLGLL